MLIAVLLAGFLNLGIASDDSFVSKDFDKEPEICQATLGGVAVTLEVADDEKELQTGLMFRQSMPEDFGMLFVFETEELRNFWMKDTLMDLDIAFLDKEGVIIDIKRMQKDSERITASDGPAMYAVEMNAGWFPKNNVEKGAKLEFTRVNTAR
jgi:uncharacterized protein